MKKKAAQLKKIPEFKNEAEEFDFWQNHDTVDYIDWSKAIVNPKFPNLKPSTETISLRLTKSMLENIKMIANKQDVPYQSFIKMVLNDYINKGFKRN